MKTKAEFLELAEKIFDTLMVEEEPKQIQACETKVVMWQEDIVPQTRATLLDAIETNDNKLWVEIDSMLVNTKDSSYRYFAPTLANQSCCMVRRIKK